MMTVDGSIKSSALLSCWIDIDRSDTRTRTVAPTIDTMAAAIASTHALVATARPVAVTRARRAAAVRCDASKRDASKPSVTRRDAAMGLGAALLGAFVAPTAANAVECTWAIGCMPGTEPSAPPRYTMPGPAYSPAEAAEERFRAKIRAEKEAEQSAFNKRMAAQEEAAAAKAAADAAAEAAAKAAAEAAAAQ